MEHITVQIGGVSILSWLSFTDKNIFEAPLSIYLKFGYTVLDTISLFETLLTLFFSFTEAPLSNNVFTTSELPLDDDTIRAVSPNCSTNETEC